MPEDPVIVPAAEQAAPPPEAAPAGTMQFAESTPPPAGNESPFQDEGERGPGATAEEVAAADKPAATEEQPAAAEPAPNSSPAPEGTSEPATSPVEAAAPPPSAPPPPVAAPAPPAWPPQPPPGPPVAKAKRVWYVNGNGERQGASILVDRGVTVDLSVDAAIGSYRVDNVAKRIYPDQPGNYYE